MPTNALVDGLVLRDCDENDIPAITAIYSHHVLNGFGTFEIVPPGEAEMKIRRRVMSTNRYPYIVAEFERKVVGFAYVNSYRQRPAYSKTVEDSIYIRDGLQGQGIGQRLLSRLLAETAGAGFRQVVAVIGDSENHASIRLHEKLGFQHAGTLKTVGWKNGRWLDTVLMQLPLGDGASTPL
ncbi:GNAT family N-acetyltransferase [Beijerinckia indica]|uniref:GCN5-related N-acetyltransferase n=1 Tax=Beijerinckia indica subsp. indica (strain ATCC 9039 / DSM 1715 / NCIMB 8712) TaxID=395963 RepID=B2IBY0_BEII9|nr:GNAT family N-acetyltransferase [Beijerinckia indica]ACB95238.1 GCN5-related N-acetyltransferase [Beijerinckia indica subsp. indica ATCC 9039]